MAIIRIQDLSVRAIIGTHSWERANKQDVLINITIEYDAAKASRSDNLKDALDYQALANKALKIIERSRCLLLEKLALKLLEGIMADKRIKGAVVRLDKPHALPQTKCVSFELSNLEFPLFPKN